MHSRLISLLLVFAFEMPVFLIIFGGGRSLCALLGPSETHLLVALFPLSSAISGSVGLEASQITKSTIVHDNLHSSSFLPWLLKEVTTASCLGAAIGVLLGGAAYFFSSQNGTLASAVLVSQFLSTTIIGIVGSLFPIISKFINVKSAKLSKWSNGAGLMEATFFDLMSAFHMVGLCYIILLKSSNGGNMDPTSFEQVCGLTASGTISLNTAMKDPDPSLISTAVKKLPLPEMVGGFLNKIGVKKT
jgi:hypothetical protein